MAGTINLAFTQQFDMDGVPLSGGLLYFFTAGTTTPQSAFQDTGLTIAHPNPIVLDASGRVPMFYLADGFIKIRLTDKNGVTIIAADQLLVIGPSGGTSSSGPAPGDTTAMLATGDIKARYSTIVIDGFVRLNGLTIGNTGSSATERAGDICLPLYTYLYPFSNITLDGFSKSGNALNDFNAGRRMFLPDLRGRTLAGLDDMGAAAANRLTSAVGGFNASGTILGNVGGGGESRVLAQNNLPNVNLSSGSLSWSGSGSSSFSGSSTFAGNAVTPSVSGAPAYAVPSTLSSGTSTGSGTGSAFAAITAGTIAPMDSFTPAGSVTTTGTVTTNVSGSIGGTVPLGGGNTAFTIVQPTMVLTYYMKM